MLTSFFATSNNSNSGGSSSSSSDGGGKLMDSCSLIGESTLKFMCDVRGAQMENLNSLKSHLADHKHQHHHSSIDIKFTNCLSSTSSSSLSNTKLSSIIASTKNVSTPEAGNNKKNPFVINIPQTMKVFSVKDILTKLKNHNPSQNTHTANSITCNSGFNSSSAMSNHAAANGTKSDENNNNINNNEQFKFASNDHSSNTSIIQLEDLDKLMQTNSYNSNVVGGTFNNSSSEQTPYHYSECENVYICNMCNSTYDSLRSIKAHLWKHSGHHKFSYPIHDYNNRSKF